MTEAKFKETFSILSKANQQICINNLEKRLKELSEQYKQRYSEKNKKEYYKQLDLILWCKQKKR